jgi:hypothetical protein
LKDGVHAPPVGHDSLVLCSQPRVLLAQVVASQNDASTNGLMSLYFPLGLESGRPSIVLCHFRSHDELTARIHEMAVFHVLGFS